MRGGNYRLDLDPESGSFARFELGRDKASERAIASALAEAPDEGSGALEAVEEFKTSASSVTSRIEQGKNLLEAALAGQLLDPHVLDSEIAALLDLFGRLDRSGRYEEQLRLARVLHGLLALGLRWYDLVRSLRAALRVATRVGDQRTQAWVLHELGSLHLCADQAKAAAEHFSEALKVGQGLGDPAASCARRHNLECARRDLARGGPGRRLLRLAGLVTVFLLIGGAGTAIAVVIGDGGDDGSTATTTTSPTTTNETSTSTSTTTTETTTETAPTTETTAVETKTLTVQLTGATDGASVTAPEFEFICTGSEPCTTTLPSESSVTLIESPPSTGGFNGWSGVTCDEPPNPVPMTCTFRVSTDVSVQADFYTVE